MLTFLLMATMIFVSWNHPPRASESGSFAVSWILVVFLCGALWVVLRVTVRVDERGMKLVRGPFRRFLFFDAIQRVELKLVCLHDYRGESPVVLVLEITARSYAIPETIYFSDFQEGEGRKLLQILCERAPHAYFNTQSLDFLGEPDEGISELRA